MNPSGSDAVQSSQLLCVFVRIRVAGIKGLQGVVRKTVNDELQAIIWEPQHMDKLIPSMLFNMQDSDDLDRYHTHTNTKSSLWDDSDQSVLSAFLFSLH